MKLSDVIKAIEDGDESDFKLGNILIHKSEIDCNCVVISCYNFEVILHLKDKYSKE